MNNNHHVAAKDMSGFRGVYSAATLDEEGNVWLATEWGGGRVAPLCEQLNPKGRCPNWSTYVMAIPQQRTAIIQKTFPTS